MDPELVKLIERTVHEGITSATWTILLVAVVSAGVGAFLGSYLKTKAEHLATKEDFDELLTQMKEQTKATETIKGDVQRDLGAFSDLLERSREYIGFRRERIAKHLDQVLEAYVEIYCVAQVIPLRKWLYSNTDFATEERFRMSLSRLRAHFGSLQGLGAVPRDVSEDFADKNWRVLDSWDKVLSEAAYRTPEFRAEHPDAPAFSNQKYHREWLDLMTQVEKLGAIVKALSQKISLPQ